MNISIQKRIMDLELAIALLEECEREARALLEKRRHEAAKLHGDLRPRIKALRAELSLLQEQQKGAPPSD